MKKVNIILNSDTKEFIKRLEDKVELVIKRNQVQVTEFIDPYLCKVGEDLLKKNSYIKYLSYGGTDECERKRIIISPDFVEMDRGLSGISVIEYKGNLEYLKVSHRDFLGALLSLGIKREKIGDIYPNNDGCIVMINEELSDYIIINAPKIKGVPLTGVKLPLGTWQRPKEQTKDIFVSLASLRLDAVVANGFGISRAKASEEIKKGKVKVNWREVQSLSNICEEKDVISFRGKGRIILEEVIGQTHKGRIKTKIIRFQ
ncbi:RNA-binding protein YlmH, contains S4-like domain [Desulfonispora thiosulfatigenes DSM 11270]|uniref:RNA-binding protein YlmH, contains S4-like domain n=1 Tax=Desulfonispora thiosulfatigenes DSM 11270 TaxID=656914 RepID=A0A1W1VLR0_DESTI|nr:YlmH/Sll1252 family protein [Desulfonispora thiosulfatigenes]SMB94256.1 RNA-binding protein YlmH, contains S4-like domain [Desulfonispora thiosulfatigenes DSM 11270]